MRPKLRLAARLALGSAAFLAQRAVHAGAAEVKYTVQSGDTCAAIAARQYGDPRLVDLIHAANPGMGPAPHSLAPGRVLVLPPKPMASSDGPDARLTRTKNIVEVRAPEPRSGKPNDPLFRGNRVGTRESSTADVTFRDETQVKLGENTLVVILGDVEARAARVSAADTTLVTGSLRARLSELAGKSPDKPRVATDSAEVAMKAGEAQVSVDEKKTTRLAVYDGGSTLTAQRKAVDVAGGFGSKAERGRPPTPPRPLPDAPVWSSSAVSRLAIGEAETDLSFEFNPASSGSGSAPAEWHLQLARDAAFDDLVVDARVPLAIRAIETKRAGPGTWFARASAIDDDRFEGKWSMVASVVVASLESTPLPGRRSRIKVTPGDVVCAVDGVAAQSPFELDRASPRTIACETADKQRASIEMAPVPLADVAAVAELVQRDGRPAGVRVRLTDAGGHPVERVTVAVATSPTGMLLGAFVPDGPGSYVAPLSAQVASTGVLRLRVAEELVVETNALSIPQGEVVERRKLPAEKTHLELTAAARVARVLEQAGFGGSLGVRLALPVGPGDVLLAADGIFEGVPADKSELDGLGDTRVRMDLWGGRLPVGFRLGRPASRVAPYLALGPELFGTRARIGPESARVGRRSIAAGLGASAGLDLRLGDRSVVFVELSARYMVEVDEGGKKDPVIDTSAAALSLGYRFLP
jgi:hypothetical protein